MTGPDDQPAVPRPVLLPAEEALLADPCNPGLNVAVIEAVVGDEAKTAHYRRVAARFAPMPEEFWLSWIHDAEVSLHANPPRVPISTLPQDAARETRLLGKHFHQKRSSVLPLGQPDELSTLWISNLDESVSEDELHQVLRRADGLVEVRLVRDFARRPKGFAYADFEDPSAAAAAQASLSGVQIRGRPMKVLISRPTCPVFEPRTVFIRGVPACWEEANVKSFMKERSGVEPRAVRMRRKDGEETARAYADFLTEEEVKVALHHPGPHAVDGTMVDIRPSIPMKDHRWRTARDDLEKKKKRKDDAARKRDEPRPDAHTVCVKNLSFQTTEVSLQKHVEEAGEVEDVVVCRKPDGTSKGFGFVKFRDSKSAFGSLMLNDTALDGRTIVVSQSFRPLSRPNDPPQVAPPAHRSGEDHLPKHRLKMGTGNATSLPEDEDVKMAMKTNAEFRSLFMGQ